MSLVDLRKKPRREDAVAAVVVALVGVAICFLFALAVGEGAGNCSAWFSIPRICQSLALGLPTSVLIAALPLFVFAIARRPLAALIGLYIILVPIDDALLVGGGLTVTKIVGIAVAICAVARLVRRRPRIRLPYAVLGWLTVLALMTVSLVWSIDPEQSLGNIVTIASAFALLLALVVTPMDASDLHILVVATIVSGAVIGVAAMGSAHHELSTLPGQVGRLYLSFGSSTLDPNRFGASLLLPIAMTAGAIAHARGWWMRIVLLVPLGLALTAVYLSASRGTLLALGAMAIVGLLATRRRVLFGSIFATGVALLFIIPSEISSRLYEGTAASGTGRTDIWRVALAAFPLHWLLGTGQGTFIPAYNRAFFLTYQPQFLEWGRDPHNLVMSTIVELGLVGVVLLAAALVLQYRSVRMIPTDSSLSWLRPVFRAALIGLLVAAMFVDVLATKFAWLLFTEMLIFAACAAQLPSPPGRAETARIQEG